MSEGTTPEAAGTVAEPGRADALRERLKERIYASLTLLAVLVGLAQNGHASHLGASVSVAVTALGLWLATLVADLQAHPVAHGRMPRLTEVRHTLFVSSPLLTSAVGPLLLVGLSATGVMHLSTALWIAVGSEVATLAAWGCAGGVRMGAGPLGALVTGALNAVIGAGVVAVKLLAGH
ncbi:hypothetical protein GTW43_29475 [Streptomyces sp. SID5785]|uniref:hypothetical protein n=1 Tax=Streptomyces sp. SID5785 TaxID=2690309 RepID=UPI001360EB8F|nr:hypothetical protein [Streptomyces sp. SID5785]MZD09180.1 hypothetical protein [Streptomyces sp. SID5785]